MSRKNCVIVFDQNEHGIYFTGQTVMGKVIISLNKSKKLKGIKLQISGYASCQWKEKCGKKRPHRHHGKKRQKHVYYGREDYLSSVTYLVGSEQGEDFVMEPGTYTYPFSCPIPANCPSSFEGNFGHVRYLTKVIFLRSGASNRTQNMGFTVLKNLDLNQESPLLKAPANNEVLENFCLSPNKAIHLKVHIDQTGYVPGQFIRIIAHINNESNIGCKKLLISLNLCATYTSDSPRMLNTMEKLSLVKKCGGPVSRYTQRDYMECLRVPATPPTCEHLCKVVRVSYELSVTAVMNRFIRNPKVVIPITIGSVPIMNVANVLPLSTNVPTTSIQLDNSNETEEEMPPPTYEEAMFMTTNIADDDVNTVCDATQFTPRYPVLDVVTQTMPNNRPTSKKTTTRNIEIAEEEKERPSIESPVQI